ncbi:MAG: polyhydroxyalkanoate synthesis regulator DNA-binding domain-containing protein [Rhodospirillales bacterium]
MNTRKIVIKKYSDRRLYDTASRRYVNLDEIARMIRESIDVEVVDASTGKDLTRLVLTQIIVDDSRDGESELPLKLLRQLVVASDRATHDFLSWYLETALELYKNAGAAFRSGMPSPMDYLRRMIAPDRDSGEIEELRRQVRDLEARLEAFERRSAGRKP